jgi:hypothetical protein
MIVLLQQRREERRGDEEDSRGAAENRRWRSRRSSLLPLKPFSESLVAMSPRSVLALARRKELFANIEL